MGTCILCNGKKAKRHCPAMNQGICTVCCGTKRGHGYERDWFDKFKEIVEKENTSLELQKTIILRMMKSVKMLTGGVFGNRNYFEALRGQFTGEGHMASLFDKKGFHTGD